MVAMAACRRREQGMTQERCVELPAHVVAKIEKVLGITPSALPDHDVIRIIEELCDTALMFDREERAANQPQEDKTVGAAAGAGTIDPSQPPPAATGSEIDPVVSGPGPLDGNG